MDFFTTSDGLALHYACGGPASIDPPVVLLHGFCSSIELNWRASGVLDALHAAGRRTIAIDARGHGRSDTPRDPAVYGEARMAADARELLAERDVQAFDLVGYSMGSVVALLIASDDARVRRLVIGGVGAPVAATGGVGAQAIPAAFADALRTEDPESISGEREREWRDWVDATGGNRWALAAQADAMHASPIPLDQITAPTQLLVGTEDTDAGPNPEHLAAAIPTATLTLLPGTHMSLYSSPAYRQTLTSFLT